MAGYSEDDVRRAAEIREWLVKQIADKEDEVDRLRTTLAIIDNLLKQGSFKAAALYSGSQAAAGTSNQAAQSQMQARPNAQQAVARQPSASSASPSRSPAIQETIRSSDIEIRPLKRAKDDMMLANAEIGPNSVTIIPTAGLGLNSNTPPFRSFFIGRIIEGMKNKDVQLASQGTIKESDALTYDVEEDQSNLIKRITINNYRDKERLTEIFNTSSWVFTRMLEKTGQ